MLISVFNLRKLLGDSTHLQAYLIPSPFSLVSPNNPSPKRLQAGEIARRNRHGRRRSSSIPATLEAPRHLLMTPLAPLVRAHHLKLLLIFFCVQGFELTMIAQSSPELRECRPSPTPFQLAAVDAAIFFVSAATIRLHGELSSDSQHIPPSRWLAVLWLWPSSLQAEAFLVKFS